MPLFRFLGTEALDLMTAENVSLVGINRITDKLIEKGVIFAEDSSSEDDVASIFLRRDLAEMIQTLKPRESKVLSMRFGLLDGLEHTLAEVGIEFAITRKRVRQIESKALGKMRHPSCSKKLKDYIED